MTRSRFALRGLTIALGLLGLTPAESVVRADCLSPIVPGAQLVVVHSGGEFYEGPTWDPRTAKLYFTSLTGAGRILRLTPPMTVTPWLENTNGINGTFLANDGRLLCAQGGGRRILSYRIDFDALTDEQVLAADPGWNMPNDLCQIPSGDIYFTTPFGPGAGSFVYRRAPNGTVTPVIVDMTLPNGIIASNNGETLYVSDSSEKLWKSYPIAPDGSVTAGTVFFDPDTPDTSDPDGMAIDECGNLYLNGLGRLWVVSPAGQQLDFRDPAEFCSNATFGGIDGKTLYVTCSGKVYSLAMTVRGQNWANVPPNNQTPSVDAGPNRTITSRHDSIILDAGVVDDGLPDPPGALEILWTQVSGPAPATFDDDSAVDATVHVPAVGTYVLRLFAFDGIVSAAADATVLVTRVADFDGDSDVDAADRDTIVGCLTGADVGPPAPMCLATDIDEDNDVDMSDYGYFQRCGSGSGIASDPHCADD